MSSSRLLMAKSECCAKWAHHSGGKGRVGLCARHAAKAPAAGSGKSLLWDLPAVIAIGNAMPVISTGEDQQEFGKRIESQMLSGMALWSIDNVSVPVKGDAFCQAVERSSPNVRVMGGNQVRDCRNNWSIYITGNNLRVIGDATRRVIQVSLDAKTAHPEQRTFKGDPFGIEEPWPVYLGGVDRGEGVS